MIVLLVSLYWVMRDFVEEFYAKPDNGCPTDIDDPMFAGLEDI